MTVSVVIPAWNAAATLDATLESLLAQTFSMWEAVVVNDGSTDDTALCAERWAARDSRIRVVQQANGGEAAARNRGLTDTRGEWLLFLDADDWIDARHLELMTARLAAAPEADAVHCGYARVTASGVTIPDSYRPPEGDLFPILARRAAFAVHACVVRKAVVDAVGGFDTSFKTSPDWDLWQRVARTGATFVAVPETLAFYRMRAGSASRAARQLFVDGVRVIENGHRSDPRVPRPAAAHADGVADPPASQVFYLLSWCAGLMLGTGADPTPLFDDAAPYSFAGLYPPAVAQCLFDAVPQGVCDGPAAWERLWTPLLPAIERFLSDLEIRSTAQGLAAAALSSLRRQMLESAPLWPLVSVLLDEQRSQLEAVAEQAQRDSELQLRDRLEAQFAEERKRLQDDIAGLTASSSEWQSRATANANAAAATTAERDELKVHLAQRTGERDTLKESRELAVGDALLNRWHLRRPLDAAVHIHASATRAATAARLRTDRLLTARSRLKVLATACDIFPIYSQTFVYQELTSLRTVADVRFVYSKLDTADRLPTSFHWLWSAKRRLPLYRPRHERDFAHYQRRFPDKVARLLDDLATASGLSTDALRQHDNVLQGFSFTRLVEAYRPDYLHSYFFYDRTLMTHIAATLLNLPRGVSCYADHRLQDYALKVVALHLERCDIVIATSRRIRDELLAIAPAMDPTRILVKPNGIDTTRFPAVAREMPGNDGVLRLVTVCRIEPKKGLLDLVDAVALLRGRGVNVEAHIVGDVDEWSHASRDDKRALDQRITERGLWGTVHLEGRQSQEGVQRFLTIGHIFVAPFVETENGDSDGIPTALLESMASCLPVVATDAGSIPEVIADRRNGLLVKQRDVDALAGAIASMVRQPELASEMARQAVATVRERFDAAHCEQAFHARVREVVAARRRE